MSSARTRPRLLTVLVTVGLIAGFVLSAPAPTRVLAEEPLQPTISAVMGSSGSGNGVVGQHWAGDVVSGVTIELFPQDGTGPLDPQVGFPDPGSGELWFGVGFETTFGPNWRIRGTGNDSSEVVEIVVADLRVTNVDRMTGQVSGTTTSLDPVWAEVYVADDTGNYPRTVVRNATKTGPVDGPYTWTLDFRTPPAGDGESGEAVTVPVDVGVDVLTGQAGAGGTLAGFGTPKINVMGPQDWYLQVQSINEHVTIAFDPPAGLSFETQVLIPEFNPVEGGGVNFNFNEVPGLIDVWGTGAGWTISVFSVDDVPELLAEVTLPLLTLDSVNSGPLDLNYGKISGTADPGTFVNVDTGGFNGWDGTQFEVTNSPWSWTSPTVADRNVSVLWVTQAGYGHQLGHTYPWPGLTYALSFDDATGEFGHHLSGVGGAPLGIRGGWPEGAVTVTVVDGDGDPNVGYDQTFPVDSHFVQEWGGAGFDFDLDDPDTMMTPIPPGIVEPGWTFTAETTIGDVPMSKTLTIQQVSIVTVDPELGTASGTCTPEEQEWIVQVEHGDPSNGWGENLYPECIPDTPDGPSGTWTVDFDTSQPASYVLASYQDGDLDVNTAAWYLQTDAPAPPTISARVKWGMVQFLGDWSGDPINITIDGVDQGNFSYDDCSTSCYGLPVNVGSKIIVSDGTTTKDLTVTNLATTGVHVPSNTVTGVADPGDAVDVWISGGGPLRNVTTTPDGTWIADFTGLTDLSGINEGDSSETDGDGDATQASWSTPRMHVQPDGPVVGQGGWYEGDTVVVKTFDPNGVYLTTFEVIAGSRDIDQDSWGIDNLGEFGTGYTVVAQDRQTIRDHEVRPVTIREINTDSDTISGTTTLQLGDRLGVQADHCSRDDVSLTGGNYTADFAAPGPQDHEQDTCDLDQGSSGSVYQFDDDGDFTILWWNVPEPRQLEVYPEFDHVNAWGPAELTLTVERGEVQVYPDGLDPATGYYHFDLWHDGFSLLPGDVVTVSDSETTTSHTVVDVTINPILEGSYTATGTGPRDRWLGVTLEHKPEEGPESLIESVEVTVDPDGDWTATFATPFAPGHAVTVGTANPDEEGNNHTVVLSYLPDPFITVVLNHGYVQGERFPAGEIVTITVDDNSPDDADYTISSPLTVDRQSAFPWETFFATEGGLDLQPRDIVTATSASQSKVHEIISLTLETEGIDNGFFDGHGPPDTELLFGASNEFEHAYRPLTTTLDTGYWSTDVSDEIGVPLASGTAYSIEAFDDDGDVTNVGNCHECDDGGGGGGYEVIVDGLEGPHQIAFDAFGNMFVTDEAGGKIWKVGLDGTTSQFGPPLNGPSGIAFNPGGILHVSDDDNRVVSFDSGGTETVLLTESDGLDNPNAIAFNDPGDLFIANAGDGTISKLDADGTFTLEFSGGFQAPQGLVVHDSGFLWVGDVDGTITKVNPDLGTQHEVIETGNNNDGGLAFRSDEQAFYMPSLGDDGIVLRIVAEPELSVEDCLGGMQYPIGITIGPDGWIYVADYLGGQVLRTEGCGGGGGGQALNEGDVLISSTDGRLLVYHQDGNISEYGLPFGNNFDIQYLDPGTLFIAAQEQGVIGLDMQNGNTFGIVEDPELQAIALAIDHHNQQMFISDEDSGIWLYDWDNDDWSNGSLMLLIDEVPDGQGGTMPASADALALDQPDDDDGPGPYGWVYFANVGTPIYRFDPNAPDPEATVAVFVDNPDGRAFNGMVFNNYQDLTVAAGDAVMVFNGYGNRVADITVPGARSIEDVAVVFPGDPPPDGYPRSDLWVIDSGYVDPDDEGPEPGQFGIDPALYYIADPVGGLVNPVVTEVHRGGPFGDTVDLLIAQQPPDGDGGEGPGELHLHAMAYGNEWLSGEGLPSGMYVIQIEGTDECSNLVYREGSEFHVDGAELCDDGDLKPGHHVVVSAVAEDGVSPGQLIAEFTIDGVVISGADVGSDTVWGLGTDGKPVTIGLFDESTEEPVAWRTVDLANGESEWSVDFSTAPDPETEDNWGAGALAGRSVWAAQFDAQGHTESDWMEAEPRLFVNLIEDFVQLSGWPGDVPAMLRILESDAAGAAVVYEEQIVASSPYYVLFTQLDLGGFDVLAGQRVVASADDASVEVAHTVSELSITGVDFELDLLAGTATNGAEHHLLVGVGNESGEAQLEPAGSPWTADFNGLVDFSATNTIQGFVAEFDAGESATFFQFEAEYQKFVVPQGGGSVGTDDGTVVIGNLGEGDGVGIVEGPVPPSTSEFDYVGGTYELIWEGAPRTFEDPLILTFRIPGDEIPAGLNLDAIFVFKDGIEAPDCPTVPDSDGDFPCVLERIRDGASGDVLITVQALTAGVWTAAIPGGGVDPHLHAVVYGAEWIHGEGLPPAGYVVWIQDAAECQSLLYLSGSDFHVDGTELCDDGDLQPDHHVVVSTIGSDGLPYRTIAEFTIDGVVIGGADVDSDTVWGLATDGKPVTIGLFDESTEEPVAWRTVDPVDGEPEWSVDFSTAPVSETEDNWGAGALAGRSVWAAQFDAQGHTESDWVDVEPHIYVNRITDAVVLENWPTGGPITLEVFASDTVGALRLYEEPTPAPGPYYVFSNHTELGGFDLLAGQYVVATAGAVEVAHSVAAIGVESFDFVEDSYDGIATAEPGSTVRTGVWYEQGGHQEGSVEFPATPEWTADFTEQGLDFSATNRIEGYVAEFDLGGNATFYEFAAEYEVLDNDDGKATSSNGEVTVTGLGGSDDITMTETDSSDVGDGFQTVGTSVDVDATDDDGNPVVRDFEAGDEPLILTLRILGDDMPDDLSLEDILVFRNGVEVPSCPEVPQSNNDFPCVSDRHQWEDGDVELTVQTLAFSSWTMAFRLVDITGFSATAEPIAVGSPVEALRSFEVGATDFTAVIHWDDGSCNVIGVDDAASHEYADPGVYTPVLEVHAGSRTCADVAGEDPIDSATYRYVVVYDPDGGFVTGGGWIDSPAGAYTPDPELTGRANFGFVAKYKKGKVTPDGNTNFQFQTADLHFESTAYDWLVITGGEKAKYKGVGTINGEGTYGFMLTARDSDDGDTFRIKIWDEITGDTVYDNWSIDGDDSYDGTALGGGSIVVHTK